MVTPEVPVDPEPHFMMIPLGRVMLPVVLALVTKSEAFMTSLPLIDGFTLKSALRVERVTSNTSPRDTPPSLNARKAKLLPKLELDSVALVRTAWNRAVVLVAK